MMPSERLTAIPEPVCTGLESPASPLGSARHKVSEPSGATLAKTLHGENWQALSSRESAEG